jgi:hypothetical protein
MRQLYHRWVLALLGGAAFAACLDVTPVTVPDAPPAGRRTSQACFDCINAPDDPGPGCGVEVAGCNQYTNCYVGLQCVFQQGCFNGTEAELAICSTHCAEVGQLMSADDPATAPALAFYQCALTKCGALCRTGADGGIEEDGGVTGDGGAVDGGPRDGGASDARANACVNPMDEATMNGAAFATAPQDCGFKCLGKPSPCSADCMQMKGLTSDCAKCWGDTLECGTTFCLVECLTPNTKECRDCTAVHCDPAFHACSGT